MDWYLRLSAGQDYGASCVSHDYRGLEVAVARVQGFDCHYFGFELVDDGGYFIVDGLESAFKCVAGFGSDYAAFYKVDFAALVNADDSVAGGGESGVDSDD